MATIPVPGGLIRHARRTITFTGNEGAGQKDSPIMVFTRTGRVMLLGPPVFYCAESFTGSALADTVLGDPDGEWVTDDMQGTAGQVFNDSEFNWVTLKLTHVSALDLTQTIVLQDDYTLTPVDGNGVGADIDGGVLVVDVWYLALTDDGDLSGGDNDIELDDYITAAVWSAVTRTLTAGTNIALAKGTGVTGFNDLAAGDVRDAVGLASADLDTQLDALATSIADLPTNSELATALAAAADAVLSAIGDLNDPSTSAIATAVWANATRTLSALGFTLGASDLAADTIGASELAESAVTEIVNGVLTTVMTESYAADGSVPTLAQAVQEILQVLTESIISGTTWTVRRRDGSTTAVTLTLNSATEPTSVTRSA